MSKIGNLFGGGDDGGAADAAAQREAEERARQARIRAGQALIEREFGGFDDAFFSERAAAHRNYYMPQLERQFEEQREGLINNLARAGLLKSTAATDAMADLERQFEEQRGVIENNALNYATDVRGQVNAQRNSLVNQLNAIANPDVTASAASAASRAIRDTSPTFSPLSAVLTPVAVGAGNYVSGRRDRAVRDAYGTAGGGLEASSPRSVGRVIRG